MLVTNCLYHDCPYIRVAGEDVTKYYICERNIFDPSECVIAVESAQKNRS